MEEEDLEKLISVVRSYSPLWDTKDRLYHSRDVQRKYWAKVAVAMGEDDIIRLKRKWKCLRDSFRREFRKIYLSGQDAPDEITSLWPFYSQMQFLADVMQPSEWKGAVPQHIAQKEMAPPPHTPAKEKLKIVQSAGKKNSFKHYERRKFVQRKASAVRIRSEQLLQIEKAKAKVLLSEKEVDKNDSEYQFLFSLLPYLKQVPQHRQLTVRNKLSQVLIDEQRQNDSKGHHQTPSHTSPTHSCWTTGASFASDIGVDTDLASTSSSTSDKHTNQELPSFTFCKVEAQNDYTERAQDVARGGQNQTEDAEMYLELGAM